MSGVLDLREASFIGSIADTFLEGLAARIESGERGAAPLVFEAVRLLIAHSQEVHTHAIQYGEECGHKVRELRAARERMVELDKVIVVLLRERSVTPYPDWV